MEIGTVRQNRKPVQSTHCCCLVTCPDDSLVSTAALLEDSSVLFFVVPGWQIESVVTKAGKKCVPKHLDLRLNDALPNFDKRAR